MGFDKCKECVNREVCELFNEKNGAIDILFQKAVDCGLPAWRNGITITIASKIPEELLSIVTEFCETYEIDRAEFFESFYLDILHSGLHLITQEFSKDKDPEETLKLATDRIAQMKYSSRKARK